MKSFVKFTSLLFLSLFFSCNSKKKDRENFMTGLINQRKAIENSLDSIVKIKLPENKYYIDTAAYQSKESDLEDEKILKIQMALWKE